MKRHIILTSLIFVLVAILHGFRASQGWELVLNGNIIPIWVSYLIALLLLALAGIGISRTRR